MIGPLGDASPRLLATGSREDARYVPPHHHPGPELIYVVAGRSTTRVAGMDAPLPGAPGVLQVIPAEREHDQDRHGVGRTIYAVLAPIRGWRVAEPVAIDVGATSVEARWMEDLLSLAQVDVLEDQRPVQDQLLRALLLRISARAGWIERRFPEPVRRAVARLRGRCSDDVTVEQLAADAGLSAPRLTVLFRQHLGCPPMRYLRRVRMELARDLLRDPYLRIGDIARRCGYADLGYFGRVFAAEHGCAPRAWRAREGVA